ncbi:MAG: tetratricopeptide repeat protein [candidate division NC10 bacterium]|nr:tetratricopeptide repeat protein [candidate division NC10 bacterium]
MSPEEHTALGAAYEAQGKIELARAEYEAALAAGESAGPLLGLGNLAVTEGRPEEAEVYFRRALRHDPDSALIRNNLAWTLLLQGKALEEAEVLAREALAREPRLAPYIRDTLALLARRRGNLAGARAELETALAASPEADVSFRRQLYAHLAAVLREAGEAEAALAAERAAALLAPPGGP